MGKRVFGFDRLLDAPSESLSFGDWLDFDYLPNTWGTIFANMSFSNHYTYQLTQQTDSVERYRTVYCKICRSLLIGGSFYYAPVLPEAELLEGDGCFKIERVEPSNMAAAVVTRLT